MHPALTLPVDPSLPLHQRFLGTDLSGGRVVELIVEGDVAPGLLRSRGIEVNTVTGRLMTARCPLGLLSALLSMPGIDRISISEPCVKLLEESAPDIGLPSIRAVAPPGFTGQTGEGVLVGIVDTGVDLDHADFQNPDGTTRLVSVWDQTVNGSPPAGFTYGTEWTSSEIDAGSATETDPEGHGSHVLGIAGGDGSATGNGVPAFTYVGVAPQANLCVVKTTFGTTNIIDGVSYIFQKGASLGMQTVVNLSLGSQQGPHDGTFEFDTMINSLTGPGKIVVASAGNHQENDIHGQITVTNPSSIMTLAVPTYTPVGGPANDYIIFSGWYEGADLLSVTITTPNGFTHGPIDPGANAALNTPDGLINLFNATTTPPNGDHEIYIEIYDGTANRTPEPGTWQFVFTPISLGSTGRVDMYTFASRLGNGGALPRWVQGLVQDGVIGTPGSADSVITVGAHTTKECWDSIDGSGYCWTPLQTPQTIAPFSSIGPLRDGRIKPDLTGPGFGVASSKSAAYNPPQPLIVPDGVHHVEAGTSMSAPHVTGAAALLLAQPAWSGSGPSAVRARLQQTARVDAFTGSVPNKTWGRGKLDVAAALAPVTTAVEAIASTAAPRFELGRNSPNPFNPATTIAFAVERPGPVTLRIYSAQGSLVKTLVDGRLEAGAYRTSWDGTSDHGSRLASGVYLYRLESAGKSLSRKMTLLQ